jgi:hypothetical protein
VSASGAAATGDARDAEGGLGCASGYATEILAGGVRVMGVGVSGRGAGAR